MATGFALIALTGSIMMLFFVFILENTGLIPPVPPLLYRIYFSVLGLYFFWWPIDMLIHWEKRTPASIKKDQYLAMLSLTVILFIFPYHFLATPFLETLGAALLFGVVVPCLLVFLDQRRQGRYLLPPESVFRISRYSPQAEEFLRFFPQARVYVMGLSELDGELAHAIYHFREASDIVENGAIDYVLDVPVNRQAKMYLAGKERLQCYLFTNRDGEFRLGFLPASNIGRALDYGFSDEEIEHALAEIHGTRQNWKPLGDKPFIVQHYRGKVVEVKER